MWLALMAEVGDKLPFSDYGISFRNFSRVALISVLGGELRFGETLVPVAHPKYVLS